MQRDRARERMERAKRQWELEHADMQQIPGSGPPGMTPGTSSGGQTPGNNVTSMNHIGSSEALDGIPGFSLVRNDFYERYTGSGYTKTKNQKWKYVIWH